MIFSGIVFLYKTLENKYPSVTQLMDKVIVFFFPVRNFCKRAHTSRRSRENPTNKLSPYNFVSRQCQSLI